MKKLKYAAGVMALIFALLSLSSCTNGETEMQENRFLMKANVVSVGDRLEVDVTEAEYASGIYVILVSDATLISDASGNRLGITDIAVGDKLHIVYNGQTMLSLPPQVAALEITRL